MKIDGDNSRFEKVEADGSKHYYVPVEVKVRDQYGDNAVLTLKQWEDQTNYSTLVSNFAGKKIKVIPLKKLSWGPYAVAGETDEVVAFGIHTEKATITGEADREYFTNGKAENNSEYTKFTSITFAN